ncbi:hypothetical protein BWQ96_01185 [Gracilariopsis chorda]|uniref:Uncharacterized protein n=1 Tax=Gracilariopsis chorda TaxID=448386 RepID=A0A2V3J4W9_9FLOR|nr:hypothetical protein BWQ96_01185 [Gracilariopsis chorda]|eukprot:PXF49047.1 hypothetical protein BWQ96_01185 [Gracilariopsis chorda]
MWCVVWAYHGTCTPVATIPIVPRDYQGSLQSFLGLSALLRDWENRQLYLFELSYRYLVAKRNGEFVLPFKAEGDYAENFRSNEASKELGTTSLSPAFEGVGLQT